MFETAPPHDVSIERAVVGSMIADPVCIPEVIAHGLNENVFYEPEYRKMFRAVVSLFNTGSPIDQYTITDILTKHGDLDAVGGEEEISSVIAEVYSSANIRYHVDILLEKFQRRELRRKAIDIQMRVEDGRETFNDLYNDLSESLARMIDGSLDENVYDMPTSAPETLDWIIDRKMHPDGANGIPSGILAVDKTTGGWQPRNTIVIAGQVGQGKSALAICFALHAARSGYPVMFYSMEMGHREITSRLYAMDADVEVSSYDPIRDDERARLYQAKDRISALPFYVDVTSSLTLSQIRSRCKMHQRRFGIKLFVIDYLQLISGSGEDSRQFQVENISRGLKRLAGELDTPIIIISQFSRSYSADSKRRPVLSDLRDSGAIEQDANLIFFLYEPDAQTKRDHVNLASAPFGEKETEHIRELIVAKNRSGKCPTIPVMWQGETFAFRGLK